MSLPWTHQPAVCEDLWQEAYTYPHPEHVVGKLSGGPGAFGVGSNSRSPAITTTLHGCLQTYTAFRSGLIN